MYEGEGGGDDWVLLSTMVMVMVLVMNIVMIKVSVMPKIWLKSDRNKSHNILFSSKDHPSSKANCAHFRSKIQLESTIEPLMVLITEHWLKYEYLFSFPRTIGFLSL